MRISRKREDNLYSAICGKITDLRVVNQRTPLTPNEIDNRLFYLESEIWQEVIKALNLESREETR